MRTSSWFTTRPAPMMTKSGGPVSSWCLLTAVAALGVKTSLKALADVGPAPVGVMLIQTVFLAVFVIGGIKLIG